MIAGAMLMLGGVVAAPANAVDCPTVAADGAVSPAPVPAVDWRGCDLQGANLSGKTLSSARLDGANLDYADLSNSRLTDAVLAGASLQYADLEGASLVRTNLGSANLYAADLRGAQLIDADLSEAQLHGLTLVNANLLYSDLSEASLQYAWVSGASFRGALLAGTDLSHVTFAGQRGGTPDSAYPPANFMDADLIGAYGCETYGTPIGLAAGYEIVDGCLPDTTPPVVACDAPAPGPEFVQGDNTATVTGTSTNIRTGREQDPAPVPVEAPADTTALGSFAVLLTGTDDAGNQAAAECPYTVVAPPADVEPPTAELVSVLPPANGNGWHNSDVTATWQWSDGPDGAGIDPTACTDSATSTGEGSALQLTVSCSDLADPANTATASTAVAVDKTSPTLDSCPVAGPFLVGGGDQQVGPIHATDTLSGIDTAASNLTGSVPTGNVGTQTVVFAATDLAGNTETRECSYTVAYGFEGFSAPVKADGPTKVKAGRSLPLKFAVSTADGSPVTDLSSVAVGAAESSCETGEPLGAAEEIGAAGSSALQNNGDGTYQFNAKTLRDWRGTCRILTLDLGDGVPHTVELAVR